MMQAAGMDYHRYIRRKWLALAMMAVAAASMCLVSLMCGSARLSLADVLGALFLGTDAQMRTIVMNVRLPRIAAAAAAGEALLTQIGAVPGLVLGGAFGGGDGGGTFGFRCPYDKTAWSCGKNL